MFLMLSILEWFLKDHVTLKTGVMTEKSALHHKNKLYLKTNSNTKVVIIFHIITDFAGFFFLIK